MDELLDLGFNRAQSEEALREADGVFSHAIELLLSQGTGTLDFPNPAPAAAPGSFAGTGPDYDASFRQNISNGGPISTDLKIRGLSPLLYATSGYDDDLALSILGRPDVPAPWVTARGDYDYTPLHFACEVGSEAVVSSILSFLGGHEPGDSSSGVGQALLAQTKDQHLQKVVVQSGGQTPLHLASAKVTSANPRAWPEIPPWGLALTTILLFSIGPGPRWVRCSHRSGRPGPPPGRQRAGLRREFAPGGGGAALHGDLCAVAGVVAPVRLGGPAAAAHRPLALGTSRRWWWRRQWQRRRRQRLQWQRRRRRRRRRPLGGASDGRVGSSKAGGGPPRGRGAHGGGVGGAPTSRAHFGLSTTPQRRGSRAKPALFSMSFS